MGRGCSLRVGSVQLRAAPQELHGAAVSGATQPPGRGDGMNPSEAPHVPPPALGQGPARNLGPCSHCSLPELLLLRTESKGCGNNKHRFH